MSGSLSSIAHVIQLSVAPVFLITGIAAMLGVLTNRLARVIDRARALEPLLAQRREAEQSDAAAAKLNAMRQQLRILARRARLINRAITLCVVAVLLICLVIVGLFVGTYLVPGLFWLSAAAFALSLAVLIAALLLFLREVYLSTAQLRFDEH
jgi:Protein of unknown function (DUF2721)